MCVRDLFLHCDRDSASQESGALFHMLDNGDGEVGLL